MVKIRLRRVGAKKQPHYRIVVADSRSPRDGKFLETIGHYNPRTEPPTVEVDSERALYWLGTGAQPSEAVRQMLDRMGILARAEAIKRGEVLAGTGAEPAGAGTGEALKEPPKARKAADADVAALTAELFGPMAGAERTAEWEDAALGEGEAVGAGEEEAIEEEEDEFEEDLFEEEEEFDELEEWEPEAVVTDEAEDFEDDWDLDIDEDEDVDDDQDFEEDDE